MGLDVSHDCWRGPYTAFHRWRKHIAELAGYPPLETMDGFQFSWEGAPDSPPLSWEPYKDNPLTILLRHSDCDGKIAHADCKPIADKLIEIASKNPSHESTENTWKFANGLLQAHLRFEDVEFF